MNQHADLSNLAEIEAVIEELRGDFLNKLQSYRDSLEKILATIGSVSDIDAAISIAHRIGGVAGTFGYTDLGRVAQIAEGRLCEMRNQADATAAAPHIQVLSYEIATICQNTGPVARRARTL